MMAIDQVRLQVRQEPARAQVVQENNPKNRKPIDPPPIIELKYNDENDPTNAQWLVSPRTFMMVTLIPEREEPEQAPGKLLIGQTVSSLHRLKDHSNKDGGFFVFGDISAKRVGRYKLRFSLFDTNKDTEEVVYMGMVDSAVFPVVPQRDFGAMSESTSLTRTFSDQGVKLRVRKDNRSIAGVKRAYNDRSPQDATSPTVPSNVAQDSYYSTPGQHPVVKRQRSEGSYESNLYQNPAIAETPNSSYSSTIPSSTRYSMGQEYARSYSAYPGYSTGGMSLPSRSAALPSNGWQQSSALQSPTTSATAQQQASYSTVPTSQQPSMFGDPGGASSIPRNSYPSSSYAYEPQAQYSGHTSPDNNPYQHLQMPGSSIPDGASSQSHPYSAGYLPSNSLYGSEAPEAPNPYPYTDAAQNRAY